MSFALIATLTNFTTEAKTQRIILKDARRRECMRMLDKLRMQTLAQREGVETFAIVDQENASADIRRLLAQAEKDEKKAEAEARALGRTPTPTQTSPKVVTGNLSNGLSFVVDIPANVAERRLIPGFNLVR